VGGNVVMSIVGVAIAVKMCDLCCQTSYISDAQSSGMYVVDMHNPSMRDLLVQLSGWPSRAYHYPPLLLLLMPLADNVISKDGGHVRIG
jgi:hypothetical protein